MIHKITKKPQKQNKKNKGRFGCICEYFAIIGATFAYFTTQISGTPEASVKGTTAKIPSVEFKVTGGEADKEIYPGWSQDGTVEIKVSPSDVDIEYVCEITSTENEVTEGHLLFKASNPDDGTYEHFTGQVATGEGINVPAKSQTTEIARNTVKANSSETVEKFKYTLTFKDIGDAQNDDQNKKIDVKVSCKLAGGTVYYNHTHQEGVNSAEALQAD